MSLNKQSISCWLKILILMASIAFTLSIPAHALENEVIPVEDFPIVDEILPDTPLQDEILPEFSASEESLPEEPPPDESLPEEPLPDESLPEEPLPDESLPEEPLPDENLPEEPLPDKSLPEEPPPDESLPEEPPQEEELPVMDSGIDPQTQMYSDISSIRRSIEIIVYFLIPVVLGIILIYWFCIWFYRTFIESAWDK